MKKKFIRLLLCIFILFFVSSLSYVFAAKIQEAKERDQVPAKYKWKLEDIYKTDAEWEADFNKCEKKLPLFNKFKGHLGENAKTLLSALKSSDEVNITAAKLYAYAMMRLDEDTRKPLYQSMSSRATTLSTKVNTMLSFIDPEILNIPDNKLNQFMKEEKGLEIYGFYFERLTHLKPHILSAEEESIIAASEDMNMANINNYDMLSYADLKFPKVKDENKKEMQLSQGLFLSAFESPNRDIRKNFYEEFYRTYSGYLNTYAAILNTRLKGAWFYASSKKYNSVLEYALDKNNIPVSVFHNLIKTVNENLAPLHRYYALRKKISGLNDFNVYDFYYPLVETPKTELTYEEASDIVIKAFQPLGEDYVKIVKKAINDNWIDVYGNVGKSSGGYSCEVYSVHPFIFLNFQNNLYETLTLAHELGHTMHSYLTEETQPYINSNHPIFTAEVASTFNENLVMEALLNKCADKGEKLYLLLSTLNRISRTLYRQTMFAEFELETHTKIEKGDALTKEDLNKIYYGLCKKYYGPEVVISDLNGYEWARIDHFFKYDYYVYQYATSLAASTSLFEKVTKEGEPARKKYIELLKAGNSDYPINLLKKAGVDMTKPESIMPLIHNFEKLLDEAEKLYAKM